MKKISFLSILYFSFFFNFLLAEEKNAWINNCFKAAQYEKDGNYKKAIEEYSNAIEILKPSQISDYLNLYIERGLVYKDAGFLDPKNYEKAIQDFTFVIDHPRASKENRISALAERAQVYLFSGKQEFFVKDTQYLEEIEPNVILYDENEEYVFFKMGNRLRSNKILEKSMIQALIAKHAIDSENDVILTSSGIGIIKKSKSFDPTKRAFFE